MRLDIGIALIVVEFAVLALYWCGVCFSLCVGSACLLLVVFFCILACLFPGRCDGWIKISVVDCCVGVI